MLQHPTMWFHWETIEISKQRTAFIWCFAQEVDWCLKDCDKQRLRMQTTVSINLWKIFAGHTGDWFDVRTASICTTDLWDAPKSFILNSLKFKVAPYPIIVSLDTLNFIKTNGAAPRAANSALQRSRLYWQLHQLWKSFELHERSKLDELARAVMIGGFCYLLPLSRFSLFFVSFGSFAQPWTLTQLSRTLNTSIKQRLEDTTTL